MRRTIYPALPMAVAALLSAAAMHAAEPEEGGLDISLSDQFLYDDNLFRVPRSIQPVSLETGEPFERSDYVNRASLALDGRWLVSSQTFEARLAATDHRYAENDELDHVGGQARLLWDWQTAGDWSGRVGADYSRELASFANSRIFTRDLLDIVSYFGDLRYGIGARWAVRAGARRFDVSHSADLREFDDFVSDTYSAGIEYQTPAATLVAIDVRTTDGEFPRATFAGTLLPERDYTEDAATLRVRHPFSDKTVFEGLAGYLRREHDNAAIDDYSGDIWRLSLNWRPGFKTQVLFSGWREIKAYADVESDYFEATGVSVAPTWSITDKLKLVLAASYEQQDYIGSNPSLPQSIAREDTVEAAQVGLTWLPREPLELGFSYRFEQRDSNRDDFAFDDNLGSVTVRFTF
jgi:exopolysaccharide biosynthesis operon protein EpsL